MNLHSTGGTLIITTAYDALTPKFTNDVQTMVQKEETQIQDYTVPRPSETLQNGCTSCYVCIPKLYKQNMSCHHGWDYVGSEVGMCNARLSYRTAKWLCSWSVPWPAMLELANKTWVRYTGGSWSTLTLDGEVNTKWTSTLFLRQCSLIG